MHKLVFVLPLIASACGPAPVLGIGFQAFGSDFDVAFASVDNNDCPSHDDVR